MPCKIAYTPNVHTHCRLISLRAVSQYRNQRDRAKRRGYNFDCTAPSYAEYLEYIGKTDCVCQRRTAMEAVK
jgi:hypothetical protein